ncbi:MAG: hypothetical protein QGH30_02900 [Candidatus Krumholzibacteria bacterium]|jgi:hypothetical protein|nr:hypothetical protein [Candidatus Krumholzibacteria bacterium]
MKKLLIVTAILLVAFSAQATRIGMFADADGTLCNLDYAAFAPQMTYVSILVDQDEFPNGITAAEFKIDNYFPDNGGGMVTVTATSQVVIGAMATDFSIAWAEPQTAAVVQIATLTSVGFTADWIGADHVMTIMAGDDCSCIVVTDENFLQYQPSGSTFTWNCSVDCDCPEPVTANENLNWTSLKALY